MSEEQQQQQQQVAEESKTTDLPAAIELLKATLVGIDIYPVMLLMREFKEIESPHSYPVSRYPETAKVVDALGKVLGATFSAVEKERAGGG